ncbi:MAG: molybdopterin cofactor-binding domain-containing protein [Pseudomonadota bacterium]
MADFGKIARRTFLIGSVAVAGGVAFGYYAINRPHKNPLADDLEEDEATFNPWVKITPEKIILITPHADVGQGVVSMQAALIAEELNLEFGQFETSFGEPSPAYYNTALASAAAPYMSTDKSAPAEMTRALMGSLFKLLGAQVTGGSSSAPDTFEKLRYAGAVARETLKKAASREYKTPVRDLTTRSGAVILPDGRTISYQSLAASAAKTRPANNVTLRPPSEWRLIGKSMQRMDIVSKSTGAIAYGIDLDVPDMVHAAIKLNPRQGGELLSYNASTAESMRGVHKIVPVTNGVAVIADNTWRAFKAADAIKAEWGAAPYPADMDEHWDTLSRSFTDDFLNNKWRDDGNAEKALEDGADIETEYRAPYVAHAPLEPISAIVRVSDNAAEVWTGTQLPRFVQVNVAKIVGCNPTDVILHNQYSGGSFGHRLEDEVVKRATEIAKTVPGVPVKLTYSREEDFIHDFPRQIAIGRARGAVKDGKVDTVDIQIAMPSVIDSQFSRQAMSAPPGPDDQIAAGAWNLPYDIPNFRMRAYKSPELAPISSWRSVGASSNGFFADCALDELIHAGGGDPLEERIRLTSDKVARNVLEVAGEMSNWGSSMPSEHGRGVAFVRSFGVPCAEVIEVENTPTGVKIHKVYAVADVGRIIDPINFENHVQGAVVWALGHAMNCEITYADGKAQQNNYHQHEGMRLYQCPEIIVRGLENAEDIRGIGEPPVPPAAPALANAIFAATGKRLREMPFNKHIKFV